MGEKVGSAVAGVAPTDAADHWAVRDWALLLQSHWPTDLAVAWDDLTWTRPVATRVSVTGTETVAGRDCWVVTVDRPGVARADVIRLYLLPGLPSARARSTVYPPSPVWPMGDGVCFPVFPLTDGKGVTSTETRLAMPDGSDFEPENRATVLSRGRDWPLTQTAAVDGQPSTVRVTVSGAWGRAVMRWRDGKLWWTQAWFYSYETPALRWALAGTSWDTPPVEELAKHLPDEPAGWRRGEPEVIRIPEEGKGLTSYTKTAEVVWTKGEEKVSVWFVPLRYDTLFEEAEEGSPARVRTLHQAENYRVILGAPDDPATVDTALLTGLREALAAYPKATLDEYPLPRAAVGGKILEDEPAEE